MPSAKHLQDNSASGIVKHIYLKSSDGGGRGSLTLVAVSHSTVSQTAASTLWQHPPNAIRKTKSIPKAMAGSRSAKLN